MSTSSDSDAATAKDPRRTRWLSQPFERLVAEAEALEDDGRMHADVVIVGSGYGGAVAAERLSRTTMGDGRAPRVIVLERGLEYLAGMFPDGASELPRHVRWVTEARPGAVGNLEGLFDVRVGPDVSVLVANGVGGGSLINAAMMVWPERKVFDDPAWPPDIVTEADSAHPDALWKRARLLERELGASVESTDGRWCANIVPSVSGTSPPPARFPGGAERIDAMAQLGGRRVPLTIAMADGESSAGVARRGCIGCGDCASGCNHDAKLSLDVTLLRRAYVQAQARGQEMRIVCGATVSKLSRRMHGAAGWVLDVWPTDAARRARSAGALKLRASNVVVAAGTLGSTELLLRSQTDRLRFSPRLGMRFSANGDMVAAIDRSARVLNAVSHATIAPAERAVGPTITSFVDLRDDLGGGCVVEDMAVPSALCRLFEETVTTVGMLHDLDRPDRCDYARASVGQAEAPDPHAVDPDRTDRAMTVALIVRDAAAGRIALRPELDERLPADAGVRIDWPNARHDPGLAQAHEALQKLLLRRPRPWGRRARVLANPLWRPLPAGLTKLLEVTKGPLVSVHPLGGCAMAGSVADGVVAHDGAVFDADPRAAMCADRTPVHVGLAVLDGAIVPTSLGINPALTIAVLADRGVRHLLERWGWTIDDAPQAVLPATRPKWRAVETDRPIPEPPTEVQAIERLDGWVRLPGHTAPLWAVLDLVYQRQALFPLDAPGRRRVVSTCAGHVLPVAAEPHLSRLRLFRIRPGHRPPRFEEPEKSGVSDPATLVFEAPLRPGVKSTKDGSTLTFLAIETPTQSLTQPPTHPPTRASTRPPIRLSSWRDRRCRALHAWGMNRLGLDIISYVSEAVSDWTQQSSQAMQGWLAKRLGLSRRRGASVALFRSRRYSRFEKGPDPDVRRPSNFREWITDLCRRRRQAWALATHAGVVRRFDYELVLGEPTTLGDGDGTDPTLTRALRDAFAVSAHVGDERGVGTDPGRVVRLAKRLTYERRSSPFRQLMRAEIVQLGRVDGQQLGRDDAGRAPALEVDLAYFARKAFPLLRVTAQRDQPSALVDLVCFGLYVARTVVATHLWSFRRPTGFSPGRPKLRRAASSLSGVAPPKSVRLSPDGTRGRGEIELTCYPRDPAWVERTERHREAKRRCGESDERRAEEDPEAEARSVPVLLIHGYSAASSTFAHPALGPGLARWLWQRGFEPWTVDLRTSSALATSAEPWSFEEIALADVTTAIREVCARTGAKHIDVVTHCMGGAMLAMALLADDPRSLATRARVRRWVMSQVGPAMLFDPGSTLRAYVVGWLRWLLPNLRYRFHPSRDSSLYDRAIHALPYLEDRRVGTYDGAGQSHPRRRLLGRWRHADRHGAEFDVENPSPWPPRQLFRLLFGDVSWVGYRHRVDALLGRTFDVRNVSPKVLARLDDFFGPINLQTLAQAIHFARFSFVAGADGLEPWGVERLARLEGMEILGLHGRDNGLVHPETARRLGQFALHYKLKYTPIELPDRGHQDTLIGRGCDVDVFPKIGEFLERP